MTTQDSYNCECRGTGWIEIIVDDEIRYKQCKCIEMNVAKNILTKSGINIEQSKQTFSNFETWNQSSIKAKSIAMKYYQEYLKVKTERNNSIAFIGQVGSGKTHLSIALSLNFISKGISVIYFPYREIVTQIKQNMLDEEWYQRTINKYKTAEILLIDDLFKGKVNEADINIMFEIVNHRYLNNLPMIISSEFTADKLLDFDEAVGSRILEMCKSFTIQIEGRENNYRLR